MNDSERESWVMNDMGLYTMWQDTKLSMRKFVREYRIEIDIYIKQIIS